MNDAQRFDVTTLYVEDEPQAREEIVSYLDRRTREVIVAANGREGLELYRRHQPDLVITDIRMPIMDGLEMAKAIKAINGSAQFIVTTAHSDTAYLMDAIAIGIDHYVLKPVETGKLMAAVGKCADLIHFRKAARAHHEEREKLIGELTLALAKVKQLSGFLPICASCKKIRDDQGYWRQIEAYIRDHSDAEFSHSICPDCIQKLYPDFAANGK